MILSVEFLPCKSHGSGPVFNPRSVLVGLVVDRVMLVHVFVRLLWLLGHSVVQLVEALHYKPEGHGFDSCWCHYCHGVYSASSRNECQEYFLGGKEGWCLGLSTLPPSCASTCWNPQGLSVSFHQFPLPIYLSPAIYDHSNGQCLSVTLVHWSCSVLHCMNVNVV